VALGKNYLSTAEPSSAEKYLRSALTIPPENLEVLLLLGEITTMDGRFDQAEGFLQRALNAGADPAKAEYGLARTAVLAGRLDKALLHLERALQEGFYDFQAINSDQAFSGLRDSRDFKNLLIRYAAPDSSDKQRVIGQ
jgi:tetratricopeptide (TPR) repeat protein